MHDGFDLRFAPLIQRRAMLADLIGETFGPIAFSPHVEGNGSALFAEAERLGLEGIVSKRARGSYASGKRNVWLKAKTSAARDVRHKVEPSLAERPLVPAQ